MGGFDPNERSDKRSVLGSQLPRGVPAAGRQMKVAMLSKALVVGIYQRKAEEIARQKEIELVAIVPPGWREPSGLLQLERVYTAGYELVVSPIRLDGHFHLFHFPELGGMLDQYRPDLLHIDEEPCNLATFLAVRAAAQRGIPSVFFTWQNLARSYPPPFGWMEQFVFRRSAWGIAGSKAAVEVLRGKGYQGPCSVIPQFGVDPELFAPAGNSRNPGDHPFTIGFAGRLVPEKGVGILVEACAGLDGEFRLVIIGRGPERANIEMLARQASLGARVTLRDPVPSVRMPDELRQLDVLVLPSRSQPNWAEQFGRVLVEAMACGVPVIGSTCGEIPSVISDGGLTFPEGDAGALRAALGQLRDSPELHADLAQRGRQRVLDRFTHQRIADETVQIYREIQRSRSDFVNSASIG